MRSGIYYMKERELSRYIINISRTNAVNKTKPYMRAMQVENIMTTGVPDMNICYQGHEFWIELKTPKTPKKDTSRILKYGLSPKQEMWFKQQIRAGGLAYLMIGNEDFLLVFFGSITSEMVSQLTLGDVKKVSEISTKDTLIQEYTPLVFAKMGDCKKLLWEAFDAIVYHVRTRRLV